MTSPALRARLCAVHGELRALVEDLDDEAYRTQFHPDLSPIGWHLGHCAFIENYWLREVILGEDRLTKHLAHYYIPARSLKTARGPALPSRQQLLNDVRRQQIDNIELLSTLSARTHALLEDDYLIRFLVQHHCQHIENMKLARTQRALHNGHAGFAPAVRLASAPVNLACHALAADRYRIGGRCPGSFDNELPAHAVRCGEFKIARRPVSNAEYLRFIEDGGYRTRRLWSDVGWHWLQQAGVSHPEHWRQDGRGWWFGIDGSGAHELSAEEPVHGVSYHEAQAFAVWAGARLPHEYEWEIACRAGKLSLIGRVWEWCGNVFHPYGGFTAFPYEEYSLPWFDGGHYTLRGGCIHTSPDVRRASFRNFYAPDKRHIFAGLRLVFG